MPFPMTPGPDAEDDDDDPEALPAIWRDLYCPLCGAVIGFTCSCPDEVL